MAQDSTAVAAGRAAELRAAAIKVGVALLVCAGLFFLYSHEVRVEGQVQDLLAGTRIAQGRAGGARADLAKDSPAAFLSAESQLQRALELQPSNPYAIAALADVEALLAHDGLDDRGPRADDLLLRAEGEDVELPERFDAHALRLIDQGKAGEAETYAVALLRKYGNVARLVDTLGRAQRASGKPAEARAAFKKAQDADWRSPRFVADYAQSLFEDGSAAEAAAAFDRALQASSEHVRSQIGKARALAALARDVRAGADVKAARALIDSTLSRPAEELPPRVHAQAFAARAEVELAQGDGAAALSDAEQACALAPKLAAALRAKALALAFARKPEAAAALQAAVAADPYDASTYFDGASALAAAGDAGAAEKLLGSYAAALPGTARYHLALAQQLVRKDDAKGAAAELQKAQALEPTNAAIYFEEGRLSQRQKDPKAAVASYQRAVQLRDDYPEVFRQMGALYLEGGDVEQAVRVFNEALVRYKSARVPPAQLETFYADVQSQLAKAGKGNVAEQWVKEARALH